MEIQSVLLNVTINIKLAMKLKSNGETQRSMNAFPIHRSGDSVSPNMIESLAGPPHWNDAL